MKNWNPKRTLLFCILILASFLRLYQLSSVPPSPSLDEVSIGYNAYSILQTGKDEYGNSIPVLLRAYDDWRPGLYVYFVIPFLPIFGLTALAVRLPSVLLSISTVYLSYLLVREFLGNKKSSVFNKELDTNYLALLTSFLLAISPWHIYLSRLGHEVNLGLTAFLLGIYFFVTAVQHPKRKGLYIVSSIFLVLSLYGYQSQKFIVPVVLFGAVALFYRNIMQQLREVTLAAVIGIVLLIPLIIASSNPQALIRFNATSAFSSIDSKYQESAENILTAREKGDVIGKLLNNRRFILPQVFIANYASHFNPLWLFSGTENEQHKVPNLGLIYMWESIFIVVGMLVFFFLKIDRRYKIFVVLWFLSSPLAAAITTGAPHAMRSYTFLPLWQMFSAIGLISAYFYFQKYLSGKILIFLFSVVSLLSVIYFAYNYYVVFPKTHSSSFQYALSKAIAYTMKHEGRYREVIISNRENLHQSYMFFLFNSKYDPKLYLSEGGTKSGGFAEEHSIGDYQFKPVEYSIIPDGALVIGNKYEIPSTASILQTLSNLDGIDVISISEK